MPSASYQVSRKRIQKCSQNRPNIMTAVFLPTPDARNIGAFVEVLRFRNAISWCGEFVRCKGGVLANMRVYTGAHQYWIFFNNYLRRS